MLVSDASLVTRVEEHAVEEIAEFADLARALFPDRGVRAQRISSGIALCGGDVIPFSDVMGLGLSSAATADDLDLLDAFADDCAGPVSVAVVSSGAAETGRALAKRGWVVQGFEDVLVCDLAHVAPRSGSADAFPVARIGEDDRLAWAQCMVAAFCGGEPSEVHLRFARVLAARERVFGFWALDGEMPVATGELLMSDGWAWLAGDATVPAYRGRGIQESIQRRRLGHAIAAGCRFAVADACPGGASHRNYQRLGFRIAYTRVWMDRETAR